MLHMQLFTQWDKACLARIKLYMRVMFALFMYIKLYIRRTYCLGSKWSIHFTYCVSNLYMFMTQFDTSSLVHLKPQFDAITYIPFKNLPRVIDVCRNKHTTSLTSFWLIWYAIRGVSNVGTPLYLSNIGVIGLWHHCQDRVPQRKKVFFLVV